MKKHTLPAIFCLAAGLPLWGQLAGVYTIGGIDAHFQTLAQAAQQLQNAGVQGPVVFKIRPGLYAAATIPAIPGAAADRRVVFEPEDGDSLSVVIRGVSEFNGARWVTFRRLSLTNQGNQKKAAVRLWNTHEIRLESCHVFETAPANFDSDEGLVKLYTIQSPDSVRNYFSRCYLNSAKQVLVARNNHGRFLFEYSQLIGNWDLWLSEYRGDFWYNDITFHDDGGRYADGLYYNTINSNVHHLDLISGSFVGNRVPIPIRLQTSTVKANTFEGEMDISYSNSAVLQGNKFLSQATFAYCYSAKVLGNEFFGPVHISFCDGLEVCNNFVYNDLEVTHGGSYRIFHNNFARGTHFDMGYTSGLVRNNNFSNINILNLSLTPLQDNNYFPTEGTDYSAFQDANPRFYDPQYTDNSTDLHANNPLLSGKAGFVSVPSTAKDYDGKQRTYPPTIGANELCYGPDFPDTVRVSCTEGSPLRWCNPALAANHFWTTADLADTLAAQATISPETSRLLYLHGPAGIEDSVFFAVQPFSDSSLSGRKYYLWCGSELTLNTYSPPGAVVTWTPSTDLSDPNNPKPVFFARDTSVYVAHIQVGNCALAQDTLRLFVEQRPRAYFEPMQQPDLFYHFTNHSTCADTYDWDLGDGTTSTAFEPQHQYLSEGAYTITLTVSNAYGTATYSTTIFVTQTTSDHSASTDLPVSVYPNPSTGHFTLSMEVFRQEENHIELVNAQGQIVRRWVVTAQSAAELDAAGLPPGWYQILIRNPKGIFRKALVLAPN